MENLRYWPYAFRQYVRSRAFAVTMLAMTMMSILLWISASTNVVYIRDGEDLQLVYTMLEDPKEILAERGIVTMAYDDVDFTGFLPNTIPEIQITRAFDISLTADGTTKNLKVTGGTVGDVLRENGIDYDENDILSHPPGMYVAPGDALSYQEVVLVTRTEREVIPHETEYRGSSLLSKGRSRTIQAGKDGERELTYVQTLVDGEVTREVLESNIVLEPPKEAVVLKGSKDAVSPLNFGVATDENGVPLEYSRKLTDQVATGYYAGNGAWGASGLDLFYGYVAVNPEEIPYGSRLYIATPDNSFVYGYAIAADTGIGLMNDIIDVDLYYETYTESLLNGRRMVDIYVLD